MVLAPNPPARPMVFLLGIVIVLGYGRLIELINIPWLLLGLTVALLGYGLITNPQPGWLRRSPTLLLLGMTLWMVPSAAFGDWPTGSAALMVEHWSRVVLFYVLVVTFGRNLDSVRKIMAAMAWATSAIVVLGLLQTERFQGRLAAGTDTLSNPNDLAFFLNVGLPFCGWYAADRGRSRLMRMAMAAILLCGIFVALRTGSRGGLVGLACLSVALFVSARGFGRLVVLMLGLALAVGALLFLPKQIGERYLTIVTEDVDDASNPEEVSRAVGSMHTRWDLLKNSLVLTARNPMFGVGLGNSIQANAELDREAGLRPNWQQTHNSYTQVSAECGIPAAVLFLLLVVYCLRTSLRMWRFARATPGRRAEAELSFCLLLASLGYAVCALFGSLAYTMHLQLLSGLVLASEQTLHPATAGVGWRARPRPPRTGK